MVAPVDLLGQVEDVGVGVAETGHAPERPAEAIPTRSRGRIKAEVVAAVLCQREVRVLV